MSKPRIILFFSSLVVISFSIGIAVFLIFLIADNPQSTLVNFIKLPFSSSYNLGAIISRTVFFSLCGTAVCLSFRSGFINLGGEGQIYFGALCAVLFWLNSPLLPNYIGIPLGLIAGGLGGFFLGGISSFLKNRLGIEELLSTFLVSGASIALTDTIISSCLQDGESFLMASPFISKAYQIHPIIPPSPVSLSIIFPIVIIILLFLFFRFTTFGRKMEITGRNRELSGILGFSVKGYTTLALGGSGFLLGLTGALAVCSLQFRLIKGFSSGWGWNGITITLMSANNPLLIPFSSFLLAFLEEGGRMTRIYTPVTLYLSAFIQAVILMLITSRKFLESIMSFLRRKKRV